MKLWFLNNKNYQGVPLDPSLITDVEKEYSSEETAAINNILIDTFEKARLKKPDDPDISQALGVLYFLQENYDKSVLNFQESLKYDPDNYSLWN